MEFLQQTLQSVKFPKFFACIFLALAVLLIYGQTRNFDFVNYDDNIYVSANTFVQNGLSFKSITWAFTDAAKTIGMWIPLTWLTFFLEYEIWGLNAGNYHLVNVFFHLANTLILFFFLEKYTLKFWRSLFVAALFAIHPMHVESVAWITERKDVLSTFFLLLTLCCYAWYASKPDVKKYILAVLLFALGLMSKPIVVTLPILLCLIDFWPLGRFDFFSLHRGTDVWGKNIFLLTLEKIPFFVIAVLFSAKTLMISKQLDGIISLEVFPLSARISNAVISYITYLKQTLWPQNLAVIYPLQPGSNLWLFIGALLLLLALSCLTIYHSRKHPYLAVGWFWYLVSLLPVIGLFQVGVQAMADRFTYIPHIGIFIVLAWGVPELLKNWRLKNLFLALSVTVILAGLTLLSFIQTGYWKNSISLMERTIQVTENNPMALNSLCNAHFAEGNYSESIDYCYEALRLTPDFFEANINLGHALVLLKRYPEAVDVYSNLLFNNPQNLHGYEYLLLLLDTQKNQINGMGDSPQKERAIKHLKRAHSNIGLFFARQNMPEKAIKHYEDALLLDYGDAEIHNNLGILMMHQGDSTRALVHFQEAISINPDFPAARQNMEKALFIRRNKAD